MRISTMISTVFATALVALCVFAAPSSASAEEVNPINTWDDMMTQLGYLEGYAADYINDDSIDKSDMDIPVEELVPAYIRSKRFGTSSAEDTGDLGMGTIWNSFAGQAPTSFIDYCAAQDAAKNTHVNALRSMPDRVCTPISTSDYYKDAGYDVTDVVHLFAVIDMIMHCDPSVDGSMSAWDLSGWCGDIRDIMKYDLFWRQNTLPAFITEQALYDQAKSTFATTDIETDQPSKSGFDCADLAADLDAYNLARGLDDSDYRYASGNTEGWTFTGILQDYYDTYTSPRDRVILFDLGRMEGVAPTQAAYQKAIEVAYTDNFYMTALEYATYGWKEDSHGKRVDDKTKQITQWGGTDGPTCKLARTASCKVVADYLLSYAPTVKDVTVEAPVFVVPGSTGPVSATVDVPNRPTGPDTFNLTNYTWSVKDATSADTRVVVDMDGNASLSVGADETAQMITVVATSVLEPGKSDSITVLTSPTLITVARLFGGDRQATAATIAAYPMRGSTPVAQTVIVASALDPNYPDALAAASLAGSENADILLTGPDGLSDDCLSIIRSRSASTVYIVGGTNAVSPAVERQIVDKTGKKIVRIGGENRQRTAELIAAKCSKASTTKTAVIACEGNWPDALSISAYSAHTCSPIFLTTSGGTALSAATIDALKTGGYDQVIIVGGSTVVSGAVVDTVKNTCGISRVKRLGGADRYETSARIASYEVDACPGMSLDGMALATGQRHADALCGGAHQGRDGSVVLLTATDALSEPAANILIDTDSIVELRFLGGDSAVAPSTIKKAVDCCAPRDYDLLTWAPNDSVKPAWAR